ncbi:hypothetical protein [Streptomyces aureocirculatus]|uniref:hypothetical protein n=1 Tax=Streptomyces aureocirculatus TaxID=67275 RepID=UPI0004C57578|nr:hypothetical protein [Streptomyces aureocirculatus]
MAVGQLPDQVREFAKYLNQLLARLDQDDGWCGVFWSRDPDGMRACLEGAEVPPWDVVQALLHDLAAAIGVGAVQQETVRARTLHAASVAAYDRGPGGRELLSDRLDLMLQEQRFAQERQQELARALAVAATDDEVERIHLDLAWVRDDHERAVARCAELQARMERLDRVRAPQWVEFGQPGPEAGSGPGGSGGPALAPADEHAAADDLNDAYGAYGAYETHGVYGVRDSYGAYGAGGADGQGGERGPEGAYGMTDTHGPDGAYGTPDAHGLHGGHDSRAYGTHDSPGAQDGYDAERPVFDARGASERHEATTAVTPAGTATAGSGSDSSPAPTPGPSRTPRVPRQPGSRRRPRGDRGDRGARGARFAGLVVAADDEAGTVVPAPEGEQTGPARTPRGVRYARPDGTAADDPRRPAPGDRPAVTDEGVTDEGGTDGGGTDGGGTHGGTTHEGATGERATDERVTADAVEALIRLRGEGRSGEAHGVLVEAAGWPAARLPLFAEELHHAGLGADWSTLLWEAASLPPDQLVAVADALAGAGRAEDCRKLLRQGVARPAPEIAESLIALGDAGRVREARALLDAYVRVRTAEDVAACAHTDPPRLIPLLLASAKGTSDEHHWDLVHALRVAGYTT